MKTVRSRSSRRFYVLASVLLLSSCSWITERSGVARSIFWLDADMGDIDRFASREIAAGPGAPFVFHAASPGRYASVFRALEVTSEAGVDSLQFEPFVEGRSTWSLLVARRDTLIYERYFDGRDGQKVETTFSVSKSLVSLGVGLAIDRGMIGSVHDPVTKYIPELVERNPDFGRITLHHLLTMSSGIRFQRSKMPWGDEARSYYDPDLRSVALSLDIASPPGEEFLYNFYNPILLGLALERATGMPLTALLEDAVWTRIGTEKPASWSLDSERRGFEKMESGFNAAPMDLLRLGRLFQRKGDWDGNRLLSSAWVDASVRADSASHPSLRYGYFWWLNPVEGRSPSYYAEGRFGQFIYVVPDLDLVMVRTGRDDGDMSWRSLFEEIADRVEEVDQTARVPGAAG